MNTAEAPILQDIDRSAHLSLNWQDVIDRLPAGVVLIDNFGHIIACNPTAKQLLGQSLLGLTWREVIAREMSSEALFGDTVQLNNGRVVSIATQSLGQMPGQLILLGDVTKLQNLQQQLQHYQRLSGMGEMAAQLAHQIRTPIATALLYAQHLSEADFYQQQDCDAPGFAKKIVARLQHIESQINDMLSYAKGGSFHFSVHSLEEVLSAVWQSSESILATTNSEMSIDNQLKPIKLRCNLDVLVGAIQNCINNAIEAVQKNASISLSAKILQNGFLEISLCDQGPGIDADLLEKVSQAFFTTRSQGTGLGLAVASLIAESHGGSFNINSKPGCGTQASFCLPIAKEL